MIKLNFDTGGRAEQPTLVLCMRNGDRIGVISRNADGLRYRTSIQESDEFSFSILAEHTEYFDDIKDFRLVWVKEWDRYYQISIDVTESNSIEKSVVLSHLPEAELSQLNLYSLGINTDDYLDGEGNETNRFYNPDNPKASALHRVFDKAENYEIGHVDETLWYINRTFDFNDIDILSACTEMGEEIGCIFKFDTYTAEDNTIKRIVNVYDMENACMNNLCPYFQDHFLDYDGVDTDFHPVLLRYREENMEVCPKCGQRHIQKGYGVDTTVFFSMDNACDEINLESDDESVKNCFHLEAGDEFLTDTLAYLNPSGSRDIFNFPAETREEMSDMLNEALDKYDELYEYFDELHDYGASSIGGRSAYTYINVGKDMIDSYNELVNEYSSYDSDLEEMPDEIVGFDKIAVHGYNAIDLLNLLEHSLMPPAIPYDTSAQEQAEEILFTYKYTSGYSPQNVKAVGITNFDSVQLTTADGHIRTILKWFLDSRYEATLIDNSTHSLSGHIPSLDYIKERNITVRHRIWRGSIRVDNISTKSLDDYITVGGVNKRNPDKDFYIIDDIQILICDDYETYIKNTIDYKLNTVKSEDVSLVGLFNTENEETFKTKLKQYSLAYLRIISSACKQALDVMIAHGDSAPSDDLNSNLVYEKIYLRYYRLDEYIDNAVKEMSGKIEKATKVNEKIQYVISEVNKYLNMNDFIKNGYGQYGKSLWMEFISFRRDQTYRNSNYKSDGLSNAQTIAMGKRFIESARKDIKKASVIQHKISISFKNIFEIKEFRPLLDKIELGNWIRIEVNNEVYKLRIISYEVDFTDYTNSSIEFSDVVKNSDGFMSDIDSILNNVKSMSTAFSYVQHQAEQGAKAQTTITDMIDSGIDITLLGDRYTEEDIQFTPEGLIARAYDPYTNEYSKEQFKITHNVIAFTHDNWETVKAALGKHMFYYFEEGEAGERPERKVALGYGLSADFVRAGYIYGSQMIAGDIYSKDGRIHISLGNDSDEAGMISIKNRLNNSVFSLDQNGNLSITGNITATSGAIGNFVINNGHIYTSGHSAYDSSGDGVYIGNDYISLGSGGVSWIKNDGSFQLGGSNGISFDGDSITFGEGVSLSWDNLPEGVLSKDEIDKDGFLTSTNFSTYIDKNYIASMNLVVGNEITMGSNAKITWSNLPGTVAHTSEIPTNTSDLINDSGFANTSTVISKLEEEGKVWSTTIGKNWIETEYLNCKNLTAGHVAAENITGTTISGKTISGGTITGASISANSFNVLNQVSLSTGSYIHTVLEGDWYGSGYSGNTLRIGNESSWTNFLIGYTGYGSGIIEADNYKVSINHPLYLNAHYSVNDAVYPLAALITNGRIYSAGNIYPELDNTYYLGHAQGRWAQLYATKSTINTSDINEKREIHPISSKYEQLFFDIKPVSYMFKTGDRVHIGMIAQDLKSAMNDVDISNLEMGAFCQDEKTYYKEGEGHIPMLDEGGNPIYQYGVRYEEFIMLNTHMLQKAYKRIEELERKIEELTR